MNGPSRYDFGFMFSSPFVDSVTNAARFAQVPSAHSKGGPYLNASKIPEAVKALDSGVSDEDIGSWMRANGFEQVRR